MTNESLENYIQMYNANSWNIPINKCRISDNVVFCKIWTKYPTGEVANEDSYRFFFIEHASECVAVVFEMGTYDLHWLVTEKMRKKGFLHNALKNTILPYIFSDGRVEQRATAETIENITYLLRQGFVKREDNGEIAYYFDKEYIKPFDSSQIKRMSISDNEFSIIKKKLYTLAGELRILRDQVECAYGKDFYLESLALEIHNLGCDLEYECKNS